jgi:hypothetical protein
MNVMIYAQYSSYKGEVRLPGEDPRATPSEITTHRLQDVMNNPMLMYNIAENPSRQILMRNVSIFLESKEGVVTLEKPVMFIDPNCVEVVYELERAKGDVKRFLRADYEKKMAQSLKETVEIITGHQRKIVGVITGGVDLITHPRIDRKFFAIRDAQIEVFRPEHTIEEVQYVLINRDFVESFREVAE